LSAGIRIEDRLAAVPLFTGLPSEVLALLSSKARVRRFGPKETLCHEGMPGHTLFVILSGQVSVQRVNSQGDVVSIARRGPGEYFGELALLDGKPRSADVVTVEESELIMVDHHEFIECMNESPEMARHILSVLVARLREAIEKLDAAYSLDLTARVCGFLAGIAEQEQHPEQGVVHIGRHITQQEIADACGGTRESVNRVLAQLRETKLVQMDGRRILLLDVPRLRTRALG
jgi:CRP-like cAMP-binding protein